MKTIKWSISFWFYIKRLMQLAVFFEVFYLLEILRLYESKELINCFIEVVVDKSVCKENRIVGHFYLGNGEFDSLFEVLLCLDTISNSSPKFFEGGRVNE